MLISDKLDAIIRILLTHKGKLKLSVLAKNTQISPAMAHRLVLRLEKTEYIIHKKGRGGGIEVINPWKLMRAWGFCYSIRELPRSEFVAAERPQFVMSKIANAARREDLQIAFTLFSATELIRPYVSPDTTYLYINRKDQKKWESILIEERMLPAQSQGNVVLLLVDSTYFAGVRVARELPVVSLPRLYADLFSFGGRGEEAAEQIFQLMLEESAHV